MKAPALNFSPVSPLALLLPYQREWVMDGSRFKIGLWSRQVGKSFACAAEAVRDCLLHPSTLWVVLSAGERQALEFMEKARQWAKAFELVIDTYAEQRGSAGAILKSAEIRWSNGSRMLALPANANTARGYSANLILDEFAFHEDPERIWRGIYPSISNPLKGAYKLRIVSTANGKSNTFYDLWSRGVDHAQGVQLHGYSRHLVTIHDAVDAGLPINLNELRAGLNDADGWAQEFECQFLDTASVLLSYALIESCEAEEATEHCDPTLANGECFLGVDIGRKHDLTVLWLLQRVGDVLWTRAVRVLDAMPYAEQYQEIAHLVPQCRRVCVDASGIGNMLAEELQHAFGEHRVEAFHFTAGSKEDLYFGLKRAFEDRSLRIPRTPAIREDLHGVQKISRAGQGVKFVASRNDDGHSDRTSALALAVRAGTLAEVSVWVSAPGSFQTLNRTQRKERGL